MNGTEYVQALLGTGVDYFDLPIYSVNLDLLNHAMTYLDTAIAGGKRVAISEAWLHEMADADL